MENKEYTQRALEKILNENQKKFCHKYIMYWNRVQSYQYAYPDCEYKSASASATRLLDDVRIQQYIKHIQQDIAKEAGISKLGLLLELKKIAMSDITELYLDWFKLDDFKELKKSNPEILSCIQEITTRTQTIKSEDGGAPIEVEFVKVKMYDKKGAINDILRAMGWDKEETQEIEDDTTLILKFGGAVDMNEYLTDDSTE